MSVENLLNELREAGIKVTVEGSSLRAEPSDAVTDDMLAKMQFYRRGLIDAVTKVKPFKVIAYPVDKLDGIMPAHYKRLKDGRIKAVYRTEAEFRDHILTIQWTHRDFEQAQDLVEAAIALGGAQTAEVKLDFSERNNAPGWYESKTRQGKEVRTKQKAVRYVRDHISFVSKTGLCGVCGKEPVRTGVTCSDRCMDAYLGMHEIDQGEFIKGDEDE